MWRGLTNKMFDLEAQIMTQASATEKQTVKVKKLKQQVWGAKCGAMPGAVTEKHIFVFCDTRTSRLAPPRKSAHVHTLQTDSFPSLSSHPHTQAVSSQADTSQLTQEERRLGLMEKRLGGLQSDFESTATKATGLFGFLGFGGGSGGSSGSAAAAKAAAASSAASRSKGAAVPVGKLAGGGGALVRVVRACTTVCGDGIAWVRVVRALLWGGAPCLMVKRTFPSSICCLRSGTPSSSAAAGGDAPPSMWQRFTSKMAQVGGRCKHTHTGSWLSPTAPIGGPHRPPNRH